MRSNPPSPERKRRTREHVIADLSVNHVERFIYRCGWVAHRMNPDYGVDLLMETFDAQGNIENGVVRFQIKATERIQPLSRRALIPVSLDTRDVLFWLNEKWPGILVMFEAASERAWWIHLQDAVRAKTRRRHATQTVHIPLENRLDDNAIQHFATLQGRARKRMERDKDEAE